MVFLHIDTKNYEKKNNITNKTPIEDLNDAIRNENDVFLLIYMEGCGPCNATRPEWSKIKNLQNDYKNNDKIYIVDIDMDLIDKIKTRPPRGFPTIRYIKGKEEEDFEDSKVENKDREVDAFVDWIELKSTSQKGGVSKKTRKNKKSNVTRNIRKNKNKKGGKWSLKYKRSINCKRPKGFSQRQHCKYGRG